jgi:hypothetical protein
VTHLMKEGRGEEMGERERDEDSSRKGGRGVEGRRERDRKREM